MNTLVNRSSEKCSVIHITNTSLLKTFNDVIPSNYLHVAKQFYVRNNTLVTYLLKQFNNIRRGDLIVFDKLAGYRNEGVLIFDGKKVTQLDTSLDDYGSLPEQFLPIEEDLPLNYWFNSGIDYSTLIRVKSSTVIQERTFDELVSDIVYEIFPEGERFNDAVMYLLFTVHNQKYMLVYEYYEALNDSGKLYTNSAQIKPKYIEYVKRAFVDDITSSDLLVVNVESDSYNHSDRVVFMEMSEK